AEQVAVHLLHHRQEQRVLAGEVIVDHADAGARVGGDAAQRAAVHALGGEARARGVQDADADIGARSWHQASFLLKRSEARLTNSTTAPPSQSSSGHRSAMPTSFRAMPRTMRKKCVSGSAWPIHCAGRGMASNGNMKPLSNMLGKRKKNDICM